MRALQDIVESGESLDQQYWEHCNAAVRLAEIGEWKSVITLVRRIGLKASSDITDLARSDVRPDLTFLSTATDDVSHKSNAVTSGNILALGFGTKEGAQIVAEVFKNCDPESELAHACVIALELLDDSSVENVPFLRKQLEIKDHHFSATNALLVNGSHEAFEALFDHFDGNVTGSVAVNLIRKGESSQKFIECVKSTMLRTIRERRSWGFTNELHFVMSRIEVSIAYHILAEPIIEDFVREESFADEGNSWVRGSKASAIRCLSVVDRHAAFVAAKAAFRNPQSHDRDYYPSLLVEIDSAKAISLLMDSLSTETDGEIRGAIGRALAAVIVEEHLLAGFESDVATLRLRSCFVAKWLKWSDTLELRISKLLSDSNDAVSREAADSLIALSVQREADVLGKAILNAKSDSERWLFLDCLLNMADPGDNHHPWPLHGLPIGEVITVAQQHYASKQLEKRRKSKSR